MGNRTSSSWHGWLVSENRVLASLEVPISYRAKSKGLIGRANFDGAFYIEGAKSVHSFGMKFDLDVAFLDEALKIVRIRRLVPYRVLCPKLSAKGLIETQAGALESWGLQVGDQLEIRK